MTARKYHQSFWLLCQLCSKVHKPLRPAVCALVETKTNSIFQFQCEACARKWQRANRKERM